jgi:hypothetical protein
MRRKLLDAVARGYSLTYAAKRVGVHRRTVYDWKKADPEFARDLDEAFEQGTDAMADAALERALLPDHDSLLIFLLKQRDPGRFAKRMIEVKVGGDGVPIEIEHHNGHAMIYPVEARQRAMQHATAAVIEAEVEEVLDEAGEEPEGTQHDAGRNLLAPE